jgi:lactate dehydrogenase-like 2-hydroxyacid dehydrogenase
MCAKSKDELIDENKIIEDYKGKIIVGGSRITAKALEKAKKIGVIGVVVGGFDYEDVKSILGKDLGVAITQHLNISYFFWHGKQPMYHRLMYYQ